MKRKINLLLLLFFVTINSLFAQFSENAQVSVLTCGRGSELFESFGHTAIRICDTAQNVDVVFNYGVFDFNTDFFYLKFANGRLLYMLDLSSFGAFMYEYAYYGRAVYEQVLNFSPAEKQLFFYLIEENYKPENRYYHYDFFKDNCATRVRDIIANSLENRLFPKGILTDSNDTFRELFLSYTENFLWWRLGIDIVLGAAADKKASTWEYMYLPFDLMFQLDTTVLINSSSTLVKSKRTILEETKIQSYPTLISPNIVFWCLLFLVVLLSVIEWKTKKFAKWFDIVLFTAIGLISLVIIHLWFISDHSATKGNWNILWANPLFFYVLFRLRKTPYIILYTLGTCLLFFLLGFCFLPQHFNTALIPTSLILIIRVLMLIYWKKVKTKTIYVENFT